LEHPALAARVLFFENQIGNLQRRRDFSLNSLSGEGPENGDRTEDAHGDPVAQVGPDHSSVIQHDQNGGKRQAHNRQKVTFLCQPWSVPPKV